ncbi:MAG TPA: hypothetical protein VE934_04360 [Polaromonas sp.]|nr:hypothetical protein [Polaromonas sp.]HYW56167.1 hypothetical protein [Polaromonas sp.]
MLQRQVQPSIIEKQTNRGLGAGKHGGIVTVTTPDLQHLVCACMVDGQG